MGWIPCRRVGAEVRRGGNSERREVVGSESGGWEGHYEELETHTECHSTSNRVWVLVN